MTLSNNVQTAINNFVAKVKTVMDEKITDHNGNSSSHSDIRTAIDGKASINHPHGNINKNGQITSTITENNVDKILVTDNLGNPSGISQLNDTFIYDSNSANYSNMGNLNANANQQTINGSINSALGSIAQAAAGFNPDTINIGSSKPATANINTMNKLYIVLNNNTADIWYTIDNNGTYSWAKMDTNILDDLASTDYITRTEIISIIDAATITFDETGV